MTGDGRCPSCGAMVAADADWCGLCFTQLRSAQQSPPASGPSAARPADATPGEVDHESEEGRRRPPPARWTCPSCGSANLLDLDACAACGTPFGRLFEEPARKKGVDPRSAVRWSLVFPGLGQIRCGRAVEGVARGVTFMWALGTLLLLVASGASSGQGSLPAIVVTAFGLSAAAIYGLSAVDAFRVADGDEPVLSTRVLLYGTMGLMLLSFASFFMLATRASQLPHS